MNILITGATGFVGTAFLQYINDNNLFSADNVILLTSKEISGYKCILHKNYTFTKNDFYENNINKVDIVFHLGASVPKTRKEFGVDYTEKFASNLLNTAHLLENLPSIPKKFIFISSVSVYQDKPEINEDTEIQVTDMYGASKLMCEAYLEKKSKELGFVLQILRLGQIYGEGEETYSKIVSFFVKQAIKNEPITIFGTGNEKRSMLYVKDCAKAIFEASEFDKSIGVVNIAAQNSVTVKELAEIVYKICKKQPDMKYDTNKISQDVIYDVAKMKKHFKITETPYEEGIKNYYNYYINRYGEN
ncbi:NAD(P)-dependent oxidoreductase [bacterium]|nr:NAD(P)-dependent oxidoreductase [bacterium]